MDRVSGMSDSRCSARTSSGAPCQRKVRSGKGLCWQHACGLRRKWHSLTRSQSLFFIFGAGGFIIAVLAWFFPPFWNAAPDHQSTFPVTVYAHGTGGTQDVVLSNSGEVFMDLGGDRRQVQIGDRGQAYFSAIPAKFRAKEVPVWVRSDKFESVDPGKRVRLGGPSIYLPVRRKAARVCGRVTDQNGNGLPGAQVHMAGLSAGVDPASGHFELTIPGDRVRDGLDLVAEAPHCTAKSFQIVPDSNEIVITLSRSR